MSLRKYINEVDIPNIAELIDLDEDELAAIVNGDMVATEEIIKNLARMLNISEKEVKRAL